MQGRTWPWLGVYQKRPGLWRKIRVGGSTRLVALGIALDSKQFGRMVLLKKAGAKANLGAGEDSLQFPLMASGVGTYEARVEGEPT